MLFFFFLSQCINVQSSFEEMCVLMLTLKCTDPSSGENKISAHCHREIWSLCWPRLFSFSSVQDQWQTICLLHILSRNLLTPCDSFSFSTMFWMSTCIFPAIAVKLSLFCSQPAVINSKILTVTIRPELTPSDPVVVVELATLFNVSQTRRCSNSCLMSQAAEEKTARYLKCSECTARIKGDLFDVLILQSPSVPIPFILHWNVLW